MNTLNNVVAAVLMTIATGISGAALAEQTTPPKAKNVVLVHGAYADGSSWSEVIPLLQEAGLHVTSVQIPLPPSPTTSPRPGARWHCRTDRRFWSGIPMPAWSSARPAPIQK